MYWIPVCIGTEVKLGSESSCDGIFGKSERGVTPSLRPSLRLRLQRRLRDSVDSVGHLLVTVGQLQAVSRTERAYELVHAGLQAEYYLVALLKLGREPIVNHLRKGLHERLVWRVLHGERVRGLFGFPSTSVTNKNRGCQSLGSRVFNTMDIKS